MPTAGNYYYYYYKLQARNLHPDKHGDATGAKEAFQSLSVARDLAHLWRDYRLGRPGSHNKGMCIVL